MKIQHRKAHRPKSDRLAQLLTILLLVVGVLFTTVSLYKYLRGYYAEELYLRSGKAEQQSWSGVGEAISGGSLNPVLTQTDKKKQLSEKETSTVLYPTRPEIGDDIGELYIPRIDSTFPIYHGTDENELEKGIGHFADSVLPGENDNCVLSGHRDTVFRRLKELDPGDSLIVRTSAGEFEYKVNKIRIVDADDRTVIVPKPKATLTVSTCYPFQYIGAAPQRYILVGYLASKTLYSDFSYDN